MYPSLNTKIFHGVILRRSAWSMVSGIPLLAVVSFPYPVTLTRTASAFYTSTLATLFALRSKTYSIPIRILFRDHTGSLVFPSTTSRQIKRRRLYSHARNFAGQHAVFWTFFKSDLSRRCFHAPPLTNAIHTHSPGTSRITDLNVVRSADILTQVCQ